MRCYVVFPSYLPRGGLVQVKIVIAAFAKVDSLSKLSPRNDLKRVIQITPARADDHGPFPAPSLG